MDKYAVSLAVQISKVTTLADGTPRIYFDCREGQTEMAAVLMEYQAQGIPGRLLFTPDLTVLKDDDEEPEQKTRVISRRKTSKRK